MYPSYGRSMIATVTITSIRQRGHALPTPSLATSRISYDVPPRLYRMLLLTGPPSTVHGVPGLLQISKVRWRAECVLSTGRYSIVWWWWERIIMVVYILILYESKNKNTQIPWCDYPSHFVPSRPISFQDTRNISICFVKYEPHCIK